MSSPAAGAPGLSPVTKWLVLAVAAVGFLFDTYELLMFPVMGASALSELLKTAPNSDAVRLWAGRILWIAALCGGVFGLLGGLLIDRLGRKTVMIGSILLYSLSPVAAAYSTELWQLVVFRCTTFIGVCVEMVAAVTWLAELFESRRARELAIGWTLAFASVGGILVTEVYNEIRAAGRAGTLPALTFPDGHDPAKVAWRWTLLTGLVPGALILLLMPFVPESRVWLDKKRAGTLRRPGFGELFAPALRRTTIVTTLLSACGYAAAFGALQLTPLQVTPGLPDLAERRGTIEAERKRIDEREKLATAAGAGLVGKQAVAEGRKRLADDEKALAEDVEDRRGRIQRWQELGGLSGRILFALLLIVVPPRLLLQSFLIPGIVLFPLTYLYLLKLDSVTFMVAYFFCGLFTVAQFSFVSEYLPKVFPLHLRGTGGGFATNVGGRMLGTMAAALNTELLATLFTGPNPVKVATAAAIIGGGVYAIAFVASFFLPPPRHDEPASDRG